MLTVCLALFAGVSAAFASWLCCVAYSDYFLSRTRGAASAEGLRMLAASHERVV